jgi:hypothetical protein
MTRPSLTLTQYKVVMAGLLPVNHGGAIGDSGEIVDAARWMAGTSPAMTIEGWREGQLPSSCDEVGA